MLYFRMMLTMCVSLFTSRVILQTLGVEDYGIYQTVGGIVGFMSFLNSALATGSSRFITFELGRGDFERLKLTFSTTLLVHIALALLIILLGETVGLWYVYNKLIVPETRFQAAVYCYHLSVVAAAIGITQVPYSATIMSHEKMDIYAYISIVEVCLKLAIVYMLKIGNFDKLILYATLFLLLNVGLRLFYRWYCSSHFPEAKFQMVFDKNIIKEIATFSGWSLFANASIALNSQGILLLLNLFFSPAVVAARAISLQVNGVVNQFVHNFRAAVNPQITKRWAQNDLDGSRKLLLTSTKYSFFLVYILGLPIIFSAENLLQLWLGIVPEYTVIFLQLIIIQNFFGVFDSSLYQALYAKGRIKENALVSPMVGFLRFPLTYILFKMGFSPVIFSVLCVISYFILGWIIKPIMLIKIVDYRLKDFYPLYLGTIKVVTLSMPFPLLFYFFVNTQIPNPIASLLCQSFVTVLSIATTIWFFGVDKETQNKILQLVKKKLPFKI